MSTTAASIGLARRSWFSAIDRRAILVLLITLAVGFTFWLGSRVPNLNQKAMMGGDSGIEALGFDQVYMVQEDDQFVVRVAKTAVNWADTNKRGMTFGVLFAACLMALLSLFERKSFRSSYGNAFLGTLIGTPLGVCVNCAAPIAKGLHAAGTRMETTLATMISSPTMNMIVLTMVFALMPWYMIVTKIGLTLLFVLVLIPIICRVLFTREQLETLGANAPGENAVCALPLNQACSIGYRNTWWEAIKWTVVTLPRNLWHIIKTTVPLMALAGLLGALLIVAVPWDVMVAWMPAADENELYIILAMVVLGAIGTFLPVPITFDVIIVAVLVTAGLPEKYAAVLLFTLGIFSVYSFQIIWAYISKRVAVLMFAAVTVLGVVAGVAAHYMSVWDKHAQQHMMYDNLFRSLEPAEPLRVVTDPGTDPAQLIASLQTVSQRVERLPGVENLEVTRVDFSPRSAGRESMFTALDGDRVGIDEPSPYSLMRQLPPRYWGRGIATGDVHNDGWPDVLLAADNIAVKGLSLYANKQGGGFEKQRIDIPMLDTLEVVVVSLVDIDDDGWLDIFLSTYRNGNYIVYNHQGDFSTADPVRLPDYGSVVSAAVSFGDIDRDGDLDIVLGNWSLGYLRDIVPGEPATARNYVLLQDDGEFEVSQLEHCPGETLTTMLTDMNDDGALDLIVGNDFDGSDLYYFGDGNGKFFEQGTSSGVFPYTADSTMSIASADIDNDLVPEFYVASTTPGEGAGFAENMVWSTEICEDLASGREREYCETLMGLNEEIDTSRTKRDVRPCLDIDDPLLREDCLAMHVIWAAQVQKDPAYCEMIPSHRADAAAICADMFAEHIVPSEEEAREALQQRASQNVLFVADGNGKFRETAVDIGLDVSGWTWNAKFADLDNDEWQDIYIANGFFPSTRRESNFFFRNQRGERFENRTDDFGLTDRRATGSYSYVDMDGDGDLDIISVPVNGAIRVFVNQSQTGNSVIFSLRDEVGNHFGIGSKVVVHYADGSRHQMREIQASGGFLSFDAPIAHFGLGEYDRIDRVEVHWSTGETTRLDGSFPAGSRYTLTRRKDARTIAQATGSRY